MESPYVKGLTLHDAVVENDEGHFGECKGWHIDDCCDKDDLSKALDGLVGINLLVQ